MSRTLQPEVERALLAIEQGAVAHNLETTSLDFKEHRKSDDEMTRAATGAAICFANAEGGCVVIGVANKTAGPSAFTGTGLNATTLQRRIYDLSEPRLLVDVVEDTRFAGRVLLVFVPRSPEIHADTTGRATARRGCDCVPLMPAEIARLRAERSGFDFSHEPSVVPSNKIDAITLELVRRRLVEHGRAKIARQSNPDLLRSLGLALSDGRLNNAGALLLCPRESTRPHIVYQYRAAPGREPKAVERYHGSLMTSFEGVISAIHARIDTTAVPLPRGQVIQLEDFPERAVREAVANAVIHRDLQLPGPIQIEHSPEVFLVYSPGPLVSGVTPQNILTHPSKPRNPALANAFRLLGLAEEVGQGIDRIYQEVIRAGHAPPLIDSSPEHVKLTFVGGAPNGAIAKFLAHRPLSEREDTDTLLVLFHLCTNRTTTAATIAPLLQKPVEEALQTLRRLSTGSDGLLEITRHTERRAEPAFRLRTDAINALGTAVRYHRRTGEDVDRKVVAHVAEYGVITNKTIQNLLDVGLQRARAVLADLVHRNLLVKTSAHARGPGVEYGPGPRFPAAKRKTRRATDARQQGRLPLGEDDDAE